MNMTQEVRSQMLRFSVVALMSGLCIPASAGVSENLNRAGALVETTSKGSSPEEAHAAAQGVQLALEGFESQASPSPVSVSGNAADPGAQRGSIGRLDSQSLSQRGSSDGNIPAPLSSPDGGPEETPRKRDPLGILLTTGFISAITAVGGFIAHEMAFEQNWPNIVKFVSGTATLGAAAVLVGTLFAGAVYMGLNLAKKIS